MNLLEATTTAATGVIAGGGLWLLAQADAVKDALPDGAGVVVAGMTGGGFCIWYAYYVTKVLMPKKDDEHRTAVKDIVDRHNATITEMVKEFSEEMRLRREENRQNIDRIMSIFQSHVPADASRPDNRSAV